MQARQAGQQRRPGKRRSQPHRPGTPHKGKQRSVKHPVAKKRATRKAAQLESLRKLLHHGRHSFALASLGLLMLVASCATAGAAMARVAAAAAAITIGFIVVSLRPKVAVIGQHMGNRIRLALAAS
jgi:hypothetical protein